MALSLGRNSSPLVTAIGVTVALVAIVGTQFLGWEWGSGQLVPTIIGVVAAVVAVFVFLSRRE
ncbi:multidrug transporter [Natrinema salsiterrestre]|uniref:Multidrug transporter n=1 Tax=Natrinema salsiterrestre TaxID=2950540 RepID=A0A9Q4Q360_9EURY|nr:multidrug transporter [Natrinema salsiterrestre]MDF9747211.1 multidrug transporter [Natrinema salsiterrestre]